MDAVCPRGDASCEVRALAAALHGLHLYCAVLAAALISCCAPRAPAWYGMHANWRYQNVRGVASLTLGVVLCCWAAAAWLRVGERAALAAATLAPAGWLAAAWLHAALWSRHAAAPVLYLGLYWLLSAAASAAALWQILQRAAPALAVDVYVQAMLLLLESVVAMVDSLCFYDEVTKRFQNHRKSTTVTETNITYKHEDAYFYSKLTFFWLNSLLHKGYATPLENEDLRNLPENEASYKHYSKFKRIHNDEVTAKDYAKENPSLWNCYIWMVWPNFYLAGLLKLFSDLMGVVPPLGLAVVIHFIEGPTMVFNDTEPVTFYEYFNNGYVIIMLMTMALIGQALLSQNSTHLVTVEGIRLKTALQGMIYDKCMRLAPWASTDDSEEDSPLINSSGKAENFHTGLVTNLVSQDTYNIMSCVWICHYTWAIPFKVSVILYLLYTKLGLSAIIGAATCIFFITPLQFYIGKKISENSKEISKCTDHRISKITEILQGVNVIKLYVWEDLFNEKILNLREVELKLLNKDTVHWNILTFSTQISTILVTVITFTACSFLGNTEGLTAVNVFAGLALFNQLTVPLLILPVTVLMIVQAMVSTKRINDFLKLPESNNNIEENSEAEDHKKKSNKFNDAFMDERPEDDNPLSEMDQEDNNIPNNCDSENLSDEGETVSSQVNQLNIVRFQNTIFSWGSRNDSSLLEIDDLDIPAGKLIMVVGPTGSGKSSLLAAVLGEMNLERGDVIWNWSCSAWYSGQPPWLLEGSVRDNIVMDGPFCQRRYARALRATALRPDLQLLPDGDATLLGSRGTPLSGGQRVRVGLARALYSRARLVALDDPIGALDATLARHVVARALVPAVRAGRTVLLATNRLELMHYADLIIVMEDGRVSGFGRIGAGGDGSGALGRWSRLAAEARAAAARGAGPAGGAARERSKLVRALSRAKFQRTVSDDVTTGISEMTGAHLLAEVAMCGGGSWRGASMRQRPALSRQLSSPPPSSLHMRSYKFRRELRRVVSEDASNTTLRREASLMRRLLGQRPHRTLVKWTPRPLRRLISSDSETVTEDNHNNERVDESTLDTTYTSITTNGIETAPVTEASSSTEQLDHHSNDCSIWWEYARACGWWGAGYWVAAVGAQALAVAADCWLASMTTQTSRMDDQHMWESICTYAAWCVGGAALAGMAQAACGCAGASARRAMHERLLQATLHAPLHHHHTTPVGNALHRFSADVQVIDKKLPTAVSRWAQLALLCSAAVLVNAAAAPWSLLAFVPTFLIYLMLQTIYLRNARELQRAEARSAAPIVSLASETGSGGATIRAARLQRTLRNKYLGRLDANHNALLLLNAANRWLGLTMDLVGAAAVCVSMGLAVCGGGGGAALTGLAGAHSLLLPAYLAHLAKCRADLDLHLGAVERLIEDADVTQEDYREDCPIPSGWQREGKMEFENLSIQHQPDFAPTVTGVNISVAPGEKVAVCGRSGSGKSTLLMSCVGAAGVCRGRILVDGADASTVPLRVLRHRLVVMPQEAILFSGTLRENLDPLGMHTDLEIWQSLRVVGLFEFVAAQSAGLECSISRGGCVWSAGRRGRACAARAVLRAPLAAALLLDEPAAALDAAAERALLASIARAAPNTTIITVAHRISSVRAYDRAVVVDRGHVVEQGAPATLLAQPTSRLARINAALQRDC